MNRADSQGWDNAITWIAELAGFTDIPCLQGETWGTRVVVVGKMKPRVPRLARRARSE
jgi:hypothetical protein